MPYEEFVTWFNYFQQRPIGWREDERAFKLMQAQGVKEKPENVFSSFATMKANETESMSQDGTLNHSKFKNSGIFAKILSARGGEKLDY